MRPSTLQIESGLASRQPMSRVVRICAAVSLAGTWALAAAVVDAAPGDLNPSFGVAGRVLIDPAPGLGHDHRFSAIARQADGAMVVVGTARESSSRALVRPNRGLAAAALKAGRPPARARIGRRARVPRRS